MEMVSFPDSEDQPVNATDKLPMAYALFSTDNSTSQ